MSTTAIGPETPAARLITSSGKVHKADPLGGVDHPPWQPALAAPMVGGVLFACTGGKVIPRVSDTTSAIDTRWPIKRVVYLMLENRSFDNLFGRFPGVEGTRIGLLDGKDVPLKRCPDWLPGDLPHDRAAALNCWNDGKQDGFWTGTYGDPWAYTQFLGNEVPNYWHWARE